MWREEVSISMSKPASSSEELLMSPNAGQKTSSCHLSKSLKMSPAATSPKPASARRVAPLAVNELSKALGTLWKVETQSSMIVSLAHPNQLK